MRIKQTRQGLFLEQENRFWFLRTGDSALLSLDPAAAVADRWEDGAVLESLAIRLAAEAPPCNADRLTAFWREPRLAVSAVNLNLTEQCNLACVYCYAHGGNYQRIHGDMTAATAIAGLEDALRHADPDQPFRIEFFGGEPLLNPDTIQAVLDWQETSPLWRGHPQPTFNRISTNLTVLDERHLALLARGRMIISVSIDGTALVQDSQRPFKDGRGSFATILANLKRVRERCPDQVIVARMTIFRHDSLLFQTLEELLATEIFDYASIYPAASSPAQGKTLGESHFSATFREQFLAIARAYPTLLARGRFRGLLEVNRYVESLLTGRAAVNHCRAGAGYYTLSPDGSVHPCHRLVGDTDWNLGSLAWPPSTTDPRGKVMAERLEPWQTPVDQRQPCSECPIRYFCGGGCKQQSRIATGDLLGHDPRICAFSNLLLEAALEVATRPSPAIHRQLSRSFQELAGLFVLCGQVTVANGRQVRPVAFTYVGRVPETLATGSHREGVITATPVAWLEKN